MRKKGLEKKVMIDKVTPVVDNMMKKFMGVRIEELGSDISEKLQSPLLGFNIAEFVHHKYKKARVLFRENYLRQLLRQNYGNITEVARVAEMERRSIHRLVHETGIDVEKIREEMLKPSYVRELQVEKTIGDVMKLYSEVLNPKKLEQIYANLQKISKEVVKEIPSSGNIKKAEAEFDRQYFHALQAESKSVTEIAKKAGLRYETVHRKMKKLGLI